MNLTGRAAQHLVDLSLRSVHVGSWDQVPVGQVSDYICILRHSIVVFDCKVHLY